MVGTTYASQAIASSLVVAGEKLKMPLSSVPCQEPGGMTFDTSKARLYRPGRKRGLLQVVHPVRQHAGRDDDQEGPGPGEEPGQVDLERAAVDQVAEQNGDGQPERGADQRDGVLPVARAAAWVAAQRNSAVSRPSRPTASMATITSDHGLASAASSTWARSSPEMPRGRPGHPEDHPGDEADRDDRQQAADQLLGLEGQALRTEGQREAEAERDADRDADADPDPGQQVAAVGLDQIGDQDADDERRLEALAQADQEVREDVRKHV